MSTYDFTTQLADGQRGESVLTDYFRELGYGVKPATAAEQRRGIDFWLTSAGGSQSVEVKTDHTASRTHNAFIETVSVDAAGKPGWAYTCSADVLAYYVPGDGLAYLLKPAAIRAALPAWQRRFGTRAIPNDGYHTVGVAVPLAEVERIATAAVCP